MKQRDSFCMLQLDATPIASVEHNNMAQHWAILEKFLPCTFHAQGRRKKGIRTAGVVSSLPKLKKVQYCVSVQLFLLVYSLMSKVQ